MKGISWKEAKNRLLENSEFVLELEKAEPEFQALRQLIRLRKEKKISQQILAEKTKMRQSHIARLESGEIRPSIEMLKRYANGLEQVLSFNIVSKEEFLNKIEYIIVNDFTAVECGVTINLDDHRRMWSETYRSNEIIPCKVISIEKLEKLGAA